MVIKLKLTSKKGLTLIFCVISFFMFGQNKDEQLIRQVFNQLVTAYGNSKSSPELIFTKMSIPAKYNPIVGKPKIEVDQKLFSVCRTYGKDSLNALAVVLSHELAHYYSDHTFCSDYAYAYLKPENPKASKVVRDSRLNSKIEKETEADYKGFFYAAAAGFQPFGLQNDLIETLYKSYKLTDSQPGYPSKQKRKELALGAEVKAKELYGYFQEGLKSMELKKYDEAISAFDKANSFIPYRENFNNMGVAKVLKALELKTLSKIEVDTPKRFQYPLEIDNTSRLKKAATRTSKDKSQMENLLADAQKDFENAIRLDPTYVKSHINLACVFDLLGKQLSAISIITERLPKEYKETISAKQILAIAYYNADMEKKAEDIWNELKM
jgi:predicted Zn-dependent protease